MKIIKLFAQNVIDCPTACAGCKDTARIVLLMLEEHKEVTLEEINERMFKLTENHHN